MNNQLRPYPLTVYKASAGSGKTFTLAVEYIKLLVRNPQSYRQILAVTFTNKATEEMKMRILTHLYGIWRNHPDSKDYLEKVHEALGGALSEPQIAERAGQALHLLLHNYSYFRVETIDSFFQSVMRNLARELNLTANLRVELNDVQVEEAAVDQLIDSLSASDLLLQWLMKYIIDNISDDRSWNVIGQIKKFGRTIFRDYYKSHGEELRQLMSQKDFFEHYQQLLRKIRQQALQRMKQIADEFFRVVEDEHLGVDDFSYGKTGIYSFFQKLSNGVFDESVLTKRVTDCVGNPDAWCKKKHDRYELIHHLASTTFEPLLRTAVEEQPRQWKLYKSADLTLAHLSQLRLLGSIEKKVRQLNEEQNRFLLSDTQQLLHELIDGSDTPFIFEKIGTQLEHIMIDEFQDTSTVQWQNFKVLLQDTMSRKGSENLIVGDVKQSIYRWRSGDWRLLAGIKEQFPNTKDMVHEEPLDTNFRSDAHVIFFNNAFFKQAAKMEEVTAYDDVEQKTHKKTKINGHVKITLLPADGYEQTTLEMLSQQVSDLLGQGWKPKDIAILVRANSYIPLIAHYLMEQLPDVKVVSDEAFRLDASTAVMTIVQGLRLLAHPDDTIAQAFLRGERSEVRGEETSLNSPLVKEQTPLNSPLGSGASLVEELSTLNSLPLYEQAEALYSILHADRMEQQSAYLCAFYDYLTAFTSDRGSDIDAFLSAWDEDLCGKTIQSPENDGIRIISIHKSKGLEFPCVLIPFCDWRLELPDVLWCTPTDEPFSQLPLAPINYSQRGMKGTIYDNAYKEEHRQNVVDNLNLLYVAFTRATSELHVYGRRKAASNTRSALIEQVLPEVEKELSRPTPSPSLQGGEEIPGKAVISGMEDEKGMMVFEFGEPQPISTERKENTDESDKTGLQGNCSPPYKGGGGGGSPFLQPSAPVKVPIEVFPTRASFKQSNQSREFLSNNYDEKDSRQAEYIKLGNVLHSVLASIRSTDDIEDALTQLEQDGILFGEGELTRQHLTQLIRRRVESPRVAEWFEPGRWQLYNECAILSIDPISGRIANRRPDRVMTDGNQTIVVDFKFGHDRTDYHEQVLRYMELLRNMGHQNVKGYLWLVYKNEIIEV
ncbi:MAG: UvrD-helicase domain-containing protein [Prevotella sp.]|nr:UvrD-helicase domain-containing protein [Prevotella sp.]